MTISAFAGLGPTPSLYLLVQHLAVSLCCAGTAVVDKQRVFLLPRRRALCERHLILVLRFGALLRDGHLLLVARQNQQEHRKHHDHYRERDHD